MPLPTTGPVFEAYLAFIEARERRNGAGNEEDAKAENRTTYTALAQVCRAYKAQFIDRNGLQRNIQHPEEPFPFIIAALFENMIEDWLKGRADLSLRDLLKKRGTSARSNIENNDITDACRYVQATKGALALVRDKAPVQTISDWYGVDRSTAQGWNRNEKRDLLADFMPDCDAETRARIIVSRAQNAGRRHQVNGRGARAIARRDRKRGVK